MAGVAERARSSAWSMSGTPSTGQSGLGSTRVSGRSLAPSPAASTTAHTSVAPAPGASGIIADMTTIVQGIGGLRDLVGRHLGYSDYVEITQDQVNLFADATGDHQWIHVDVDRANRESPFGGPIAHGYLTLALGPRLAPQVTRVEGIKMAVNYGCDKVRVPSPVPVGSKLRLGIELLEVNEIAGGVQVKERFTFEIEGAAKPACVAENLFRYYE
jgi:acyl dehydratase